MGDVRQIPRFQRQRDEDLSARNICLTWSAVNRRNSGGSVEPPAKTVSVSLVRTC